MGSGDKERSLSIKNDLNQLQNKRNICDTNMQNFLLIVGIAGYNLEGNYYKLTSLAILIDPPPLMINITHSNPDRTHRIAEKTTEKNPEKPWCF